MWLTHQPGRLAILNEGPAIGKLGPRTRNACPVSPNWQLAGAVPKVEFKLLHSRRGAAMMRQMVFLLLLSSTLWAQSAGGQPRLSTQNEQDQADAAGQSAMRPSSGEAGDDLAQMRSDLNHMESLLNNMSSEITFLRDQNLQILLNTNARMWTILIRDLRLQIDREEERRTGKRAPSAAEPQVRQNH
jgi:hypothetical protein